MRVEGYILIVLTVLFCFVLACEFLKPVLTDQEAHALATSAVKQKIAARCGIEGADLMQTTVMEKIWECLERSTLQDRVTSEDVREFFHIDAKVKYAPRSVNPHDLAQWLNDKAKGRREHSYRKEGQ